MLLLWFAVLGASGTSAIYALECRVAGFRSNMALGRALYIDAELWISLLMTPTADKSPLNAGKSLFTNQYALKNEISEPLIRVSRRSRAASNDSRCANDAPWSSPPVLAGGMPFRMPASDIINMRGSLVHGVHHRPARRSLSILKLIIICSCSILLTPRLKR